ncbi:hypothetical protein HDA32_004731 [Spinactinospora alkalitolerans]|uniref:DNA primase/polymerase bifunctional N-terminal domain-containing protein n=1 Tax=Spinactinospora alkalitolerans TaxID=687207 RepID=A0A852U0I5_9ACTN|nr:bifunctional DNA primase/polymerase [Spinactinospora alkalitolerans]NYE49611.1 hypothetical protein [Spinactinospora alkalitolerans]
MSVRSVLPYVLAAAKRGWYVFPLVCGGKQPVRRFCDWERHATTDPDLIVRFWSGGAFNYGIACGPSGLVVIDLDTPKPGETAPPEWSREGITDGADVFAALAETHAGGELPLDTFTVRTRRGGLHLYYAAPAGVQYRNTAGRTPKGLGWLIDTRAHGGYVVGPGSHVAGADASGPYTVENAAPPAPLPAWLGALLPKEGEHTTSGQVHQMLATYRDAAGYAAAALRGEVERVLSARTGHRNHTLNAAAFALGTLIGGGVLPKHLAEDALLAAGQQIGLPPAECEATVHSGIQAGLRKPRGGAA